MCDPLVISGIALSVGSTVANYAASSAVESARNEAIAVERQLQKQFDKETFGINDSAQTRYTGFEGNMANKQQQIGDYLASQTVAEPGADAALPSSSSNIAVREEAKQRGKARQETDANAENLARLRSFGDLLGEFGRSDARDAGSIAQIGGFKVGSSNILPFELEEAQRAGDGMKLLGDILGLGGTVATGAGLSGATPFGTNIATSGGTRLASFTPSVGWTNHTGLRLPNLYGGATI